MYSLPFQKQYLMAFTCHPSFEVARSVCSASSRRVLPVLRRRISRCLLRPGARHGRRRYGEVARPRAGVLLRALHRPFRPQRSRSLKTRRRQFFFFSLIKKNGSGASTAPFLSEVVRVVAGGRRRHRRSLTRSPFFLSKAQYAQQYISACASRSRYVAQRFAWLPGTTGCTVLSKRLQGARSQCGDGPVRTALGGSSHARASGRVSCFFSRTCFALDNGYI